MGRAQCEDTEGSQGDWPQQNQPCQHHDWTSSLQSCEEMNVYCLRPQPVVLFYGGLSRVTKEEERSDNQSDGEEQRRATEQKAACREALC